MGSNAMTDQDPSCVANHSGPSLPCGPSATVQEHLMAPALEAPLSSLPNRALLPVLAFCGICATFLQTLVVPIQAELPELLNAPRSATAWVITVTLLSGAVLNPISGRLGDLYGKRLMILVLLVLMVLGSVIAALANGLVQLLIGRALQGAPFGLIPLAVSLLRDLLPPHRLPTAVALVSATLGVGGALGLPLSAVISENLNWHMLFWSAAGLGLLSALLVVFVVPKDVMRVPGHFDPIGAIGLAIGLSGVMIAVSQGQVWGWGSLPTLATGLGGLIVLACWAWFELLHGDPVVDLRVAVRRRVLFTNLASVALGFSLFTSQVAYPQLLELPADTEVGLGMPLFQAALVLMTAGVLMIVISPLTAWLTKYVGARVMLAAGGGIVFLSYAISALSTPSLGTVLAANICIGLGVGAGFAAMPNLIMNAVPVTETAAANGLNTLMRLMGTTIAGAVIGAQLAAHSVPHGSTTVPTALGFTIAFVLGGVGALLCVVFALSVPRRNAGPTGAEGAVVRGSGEETV